MQEPKKKKVNIKYLIMLEFKKMRADVAQLDTQTKYLDVFIKSIPHTMYVQTRTQYQISFTKSDSLFDFRAKYLSEVSTRLDVQFKNMYLISENQLTIYK